MTNTRDTMNTQPQSRSDVEALRLADELEVMLKHGLTSASATQDAAAELRRLHEANQELIRLQYEVDAIPAIKEERDNLQVEVRILREKVKEQCRINDMEAQPVAWLDPWTQNNVTTDYDAYGKHGIPLYTTPPAERTPRQPEPVIDKSAAIRIATALGWTPPRESWVGLTDEELRKIWYDDDPVQGGTYIDKLRQVEAKLKAKNSP